MNDVTINRFEPRDEGTLRGLLSATLPDGIVLHDLEFHSKDKARWIDFPICMSPRTGRATGWERAARKAPCPLLQEMW